MPASAPAVLVVDDERDTLLLLKMALQRAGFRPALATSWEEVAERVREAYEDGDGFDAVVLDLMIPVRSGFDILRALQVVLSPLPPVVMLTAVTAFEKQVEARSMGVSRYLTKPTTPKKLISTLREVITEHKSGLP